MKNFFKYLCLIIGVIVNAQEQEVSTEIQTQGPSYLSFDVTSPFNFGTPRYRLGYIHGFGTSWKASVDIGYGSEGISITKFSDIASENYKLMEVRAEAYYIFKATSSVEHYLAAELFYINHTETIISNYYYPENEAGIVRYDEADYRRQKQGAHIKYGALIAFGKRFGVNVYYGIGIRYRDIEFNNLIDPREDNDPEDEYPIFNGLYRNQGSNIGLSMALGIKFLFRL
ncbi:hypothetical protein [Altibacter sp.]|uniref:hypothetical protein n=1 Tax=Altibacter sp. TaxID=2024823 RepID=UPI000C98C3C6|nr:hypothetical protein [Altibacter sp.]MAP53777.1 hypothetical protein [Altibacter sp.]